MNIFSFFKNELIKITISNKKSLEIKNESALNNLQIELAPDKFNCDISTNVAMVTAKSNDLDVMDLANKLKDLYKSKIKDIKSIDIAGNGFLNINLSDKFVLEFIDNVFNKRDVYGARNENKNINVEFVSANPTGPLHVGHCRGAILGDVICNLLTFNNNNVVKEYYINDYGNQVNNFTKSVYFRIMEIKYDETFPNSQDLYPGSYIIEIAKKIINKKSKLDFRNYQKNSDIIKKLSLEYTMEMIKNDLKNLGIQHNNFVSENEIVNKDLVNKTVTDLINKKIVYEGYLSPPKGEDLKDWKKMKRLVFKSSKYGDDTDRALQKNDGSWTYFANDLAYHKDKIDRNFEILINVLGADHTGYIKRISAAVDAISNKETKLICKVSQLVKLYKDGEPFKMSKRGGEFITVNDLLKEVDKDSIRFMMLSRSNDVELDFDFKKVVEKTKDNPVFYVQYAFARINSIFRNLKIDLDKRIEKNKSNFEINDYEKRILRKIFEWPKIVEKSSSKYEPHRISYYLYELSTIFHSYWSKGNEDKKYRFITNNEIRNINSLIIFQLISIVIINGMKILGVSLPEKM